MSLPPTLAAAASTAADIATDIAAALISSEPRPAWRITVNNQDISATISQRLISLTLEDKTGFEADTVTLTLDDTDGALELPPKGATLAIAIGWHGAPLVDKGSYTVDEVEHSGAPDQLTIRATSADMRTELNVQRDQSWHNTTLGQIADTIATRNKLTPKTLPKLRDIAIPHIDQTAESDASFISRLAATNGGIASVKNGHLLILAPGEATTASGKPLPPVTITRRSGDQHRFTAADRNAYNAVHAQWHDTSTGKRGTIVADAQGVRPLHGDPATAKQEAALAEENAQRSQKRAQAARKKAAATKTPAAQARAERAEAVAKKRQHRAAELNHQAAQTSAPPANDPTLPSTGTPKLLRHIYATKSTAERGAKTAFAKIQNGIASFDITLAHGNPDLIPELPAVISGHKPQINNAPWILGNITHSITTSGYTTRIALTVSIEEVD